MSRLLSRAAAGPASRWRCCTCRQAAATLAAAGQRLLLQRRRLAPLGTRGHSNIQPAVWLEVRVVVAFHVQSRAEVFSHAHAILCVLRIHTHEKKVPLQQVQRCLGRLSHTSKRGLFSASCCPCAGRRFTKLARSPLRAALPARRSFVLPQRSHLPLPWRTALPSMALLYL